MAFRDLMNDVMNFLGLVTDEEHEQRRNMNKNSGNNSKKRSGAGNYGSSRYDDDFDADEPQIRRVPSSGRNTARSYVQPDDDIFDADKLFAEEGGNARPNYGTRSGSAAQRSTGRTAQGGRYNGYSDDVVRGGAQQDDFGRSRTTDYTRGESTMNTRENARPTNARQNTRQNEGGRYQMAVRKLKSVDECKEVIQLLLANTTVVMSLEEMDTVQAQRVVDTMGGATFAIGAKMNKTSARGWILTPSSVDVENKYGTGSDSPF